MDASSQAGGYAPPRRNGRMMNAKMTALRRPADAKSLFYACVRSELRSELPREEMRVLWGIVRANSDGFGLLLCDLVFDVFEVRHGRTIVAGPAVDPSFRRREYEFVATVVKHLSCAGSGTARTMLAGGSTGVDVSFVRWCFSHLTRIFRFMDEPAMAAGLELAWANWESAMRSAAELVVFEETMFENIGHALICIAIDIAEQTGLLNKVERRRLVGSVVDNPYLFEQIAGPIPEYQVQGGTRGSGIYLEPAVGARHYLLSDGDVVSLGRFISKCIDRHFRSSARPLVTIEPAARERLIEGLCSLGVRADQRIVTIHVREEARERRSAAATRTRDAKIASYMAAISYLVDRGYTVVRLGDRSMTPIGNQRGLFDYPFSDLKSDSTDVILASICDFHIGTSSGMSHIPLLFDKPVLYTNWFPLGEYIYSRRSLLITKTLVDEEGVDIPFLDANRLHAGVFDRYYLDQKGISVRDNTSEEILAAVQDMVTIGAEPVAAEVPLKIRIAPSFAAKLKA